MKNIKEPSIFTERGGIGSDMELDKYGVWVKNEPEDLPLPDASAASKDLSFAEDSSQTADLPPEVSFDEASAPETDGVLPPDNPVSEGEDAEVGESDFDFDGFLDSDTTQQAAVGAEAPVMEAPEPEIEAFETEAPPDEDIRAEEAAADALIDDIPEFNEIPGLEDEIPDGVEVAAVPAPEAERGVEEALPEPESPVLTEAEEERALPEIEASPPEIEDEGEGGEAAADGVEDAEMEDAEVEKSAEAEPLPVDSGNSNVPTELLLKIANELSLLKAELAELKSEVQTKPAAAPAQSSPPVASAAPPMPAPAQSPPPVASAAPPAPVVSAAVKPPEPPPASEPDAASPDEAGFFGDEDDEKIALTGDELENVLLTSDTDIQPEESAADEGKTEDVGFFENEEDEKIALTDDELENALTETDEALSDEEMRNILNSAEMSTREVEGAASEIAEAPDAEAEGEIAEAPDTEGEIPIPPDAEDNLGLPSLEDIPPFEEGTPEIEDAPQEAEIEDIPESAEIPEIETTESEIEDAPGSGAEIETEIAEAPPEELLAEVPPQEAEIGDAPESEDGESFDLPEFSPDAEAEGTPLELTDEAPPAEGDAFDLPEFLPENETAADEETLSLDPLSNEEDAIPQEEEEVAPPEEEAPVEEEAATVEDEAAPVEDEAAMTEEPAPPEEEPDAVHEGQAEPETLSDDELNNILNSADITADAENKNEGKTEETAAEDAGAEEDKTKGKTSLDDETFKNEIRTVLAYMDQLLEALPEEKIKEFANSDKFEIYKKVFKDLDLV